MLLGDKKIHLLFFYFYPLLLFTSFAYQKCFDNMEYLKRENLEKNMMLGMNEVSDDEYSVNDDQEDILGFSLIKPFLKERL